MTRFRPVRAAAPFAAALLLPACGSLLGGGKPADLYRFGAPAPVAAPTTGGVLPATTRTLLLMPVRFAAEIEGDKILAAQGQKTLYIKGIRWAAPAPTLFTQSLVAGFAARVPQIAIVDRRAAGNADASLLIGIDRFEAQYDGDTKAAPNIVIDGRATLTDARTNLPIGSYRLSATVRAGANNAREIAAAFDRANSDAVGAAVDWAAATLLATSASDMPGIDKK